MNIIDPQITQIAPISREYQASSPASRVSLVFQNLRNRRNLRIRIQILALHKTLESSPPKNVVCFSLDLGGCLTCPGFHAS
jgi:hypothetical protein